MYNIFSTADKDVHWNLEKKAPCFQLCKFATMFSATFWVHTSRIMPFN